MFSTSTNMQHSQNLIFSFYKQKLLIHLNYLLKFIRLNILKLQILQILLYHINLSVFIYLLSETEPMEGPELLKKQFQLDETSDFIKELQQRDINMSTVLNTQCLKQYSFSSQSSDPELPSYSQSSASFLSQSIKLTIKNSENINSQGRSFQSNSQAPQRQLHNIISMQKCKSQNWEQKKISQNYRIENGHVHVQIGNFYKKQEKLIVNQLQKKINLKELEQEIKQLKNRKIKSYTVLPDNSLESIKLTLTLQEQTTKLLSYIVCDYTSCRDRGEKLQVFTDSYSSEKKLYSVSSSLKFQAQNQKKSAQNWKQINLLNPIHFQKGEMLKKAIKQNFKELSQAIFQSIRVFKDQSRSGKSKGQFIKVQIKLKGDEQQQQLQIQGYYRPNKGRFNQYQKPTIKKKTKRVYIVG